MQNKIDHLKEQILFLQKHTNSKIENEYLTALGTEESQE